MARVRALRAETDRVVGVWGTLREWLATNPLQWGSSGIRMLDDFGGFGRVDNQAAQSITLWFMKLLIPSVVAMIALGAPVYGDDASAARKAAAAERKAEAVRKAEVKSLKQEVQALRSQKTSGAKEYGDKVRAINAKKDVIRAKERQ